MVTVCERARSWWLSRGGCSIFSCKQERCREADRSLPQQKAHSSIQGLWTCGRKLPSGEANYAQGCSGGASFSAATASVAVKIPAGRIPGGRAKGTHAGGEGRGGFRHLGPYSLGRGRGKGKTGLHHFQALLLLVPNWLGLEFCRANKKRYLDRLHC